LQEADLLNSVIHLAGGPFIILGGTEICCVCVTCAFCHFQGREIAEPTRQALAFVKLLECSSFFLQYAINFKNVAAVVVQDDTSGLRWRHHL